jgi:hypothetical protein
MIKDYRYTSHGEHSYHKIKHCEWGEENFDDFLKYYNSLDDSEKLRYNNLFGCDDVNSLLDIRYELNTFGFRSPYEYTFGEHKNSLWIFGDSISYGHGVKYENTWPYLLSKKIGLTLYNFSVCGRGIDTAIRLAEEWLKNSVNKPDIVISYGYYTNRHEFPNMTPANHQGRRYKHYDTMQHMSRNHPDQEKLYREKEKYLVNLFQSYKIKFYNLDFLSEQHGWHNFYIDFGKDVSKEVISHIIYTKNDPILPHDEEFTNLEHQPHPGIKSHKLICDHIYDVIEKDK